MSITLARKGGKKLTLIAEWQSGRWERVRSRANESGVEEKRDRYHTRRVWNWNQSRESERLGELGIGSEKNGHMPIWKSARERMDGNYRR